MNRYIPRTASKKWLEGAPDYILSIHDRPSFHDRYTVFFKPQCTGTLGNGPGDTWIQYVGVSADARSYWGELKAFERNTNNKVKWLDLPEKVRQEVILRYEEE